MAVDACSVYLKNATNDQGYLIEEQGMTYLTDTDPDLAFEPLQAAACTYRIAFGPESTELQTAPTQESPPTPGCCGNKQGISLHAEVCCAAHEMAVRPHLGEQREWDVEKAQEVLVPGEGMDVEKERPGGVRDIGRVHRAAREAKEQVAIDRPEAELPALSAAARAREVREQPGELGGAE